MKLQGLAKVCAIILCCLGSNQLLAQQLKLGTNPSTLKQSALLELESTKQALLITRIADTTQIVTPVNGMIIYLTTDNSFRVRANNYWNKLIPAGSAIQSINSDATPAQNIVFKYTPAGTFGLATTAGTHTLTIPDASLTAPGFMNIGAQSFKGLKNFTDGLQTANLRVVNDLSTPTKILGKDVNGDVSALTLGTTLDLTTGTLNANNASRLWNANKIADYNVSFATAPATDQVLTYNGTQWIAKAPTTGGISSIGLTLPSMFTVTGSPLTANGTITATLATQNANTVFAGPTTGVAAAPTFRLLGATDIPALDASKITTGVLPLTLGGTGLSTVGAVGNLIRVKNATTLEYFTPSYLDGTNKISIIPGSGVMALAPSSTQTLSTNPSWTISVDSSKNIWNANKIQNKVVSTTAPTDGQLLKWNNATSMYVPADDITGGASYGDLKDASGNPTNDITYADAPDPKYRMKIWQSPNSGVVTNGPGGTSAWAWSVLSFQNTGYTTQLYFDKNTLALREWKNNTAAPPPLTAGVHPWYKLVTTNGANNFTDGGVIFAGKTSDATSEVTQDPGNLFWDNTAKELGIKTNNPAASLDVNGTVKLGIGGTVFNNLIRDVATLPPKNNITKSSTTTVTFNYPNAAAGAIVTVSPRADPGPNFIIGAAFVKTAGVVTVTIANVNSTNATSNFAGVVCDFTIVQ